MLASVQDFAHTPDPLLAPGKNVLLAAEKITLVTPENRGRGAVLGRVVGTITPSAWAGNTVSSGTIASATALAGVQEGTYKVMCVEPASNAGAFLVEGPDGKVVGRATVGVAFATQLAFTITDATDFVVGDGFDIVVAKGTLYKLAAAAATDGSATPRVILQHAADATAANVEAMAYTRGDFIEDGLTLGAGHTIASIRAALKQEGIHLVKTTL